ncbi:MAG: hypothetical protein LUH19_10210 [Lachnospiraceae bacterium]|nr:hypothetical protein [Lachnospiraceae bacterium]
MDKNVSITTDLDGRKIAIINDIRFQSRRGIEWDKVEKYLKEYIGLFFEITETSEKVYIGSDFPDEFSHSNDTKELRGANVKAKANMISAIGELVQIADDKVKYPDFSEKHGAKARLGWHRYTTRFGLPVYDKDGVLERYNVFTARMLVRCDEDGKLYLYDFVRTKKETSKPHEH